MAHSSQATLLGYGMCNTLNVAPALEHIGANLTATEFPYDAERAERLVASGVGVFSGSMVEVIRRGQGDAIRNFPTPGRPLFAICVDTQILFEGSEEFSDSVGRRLLKGRVVA